MSSSSLSSSQTSSTTSSSSSSSSSVVVSGLDLTFHNEIQVKDKSKMSRYFIAWMVFACLNFFFFIPGGFLLTIVGYNCHSMPMLTSGILILLLFFIVIPGLGVGHAVRKQFKATNEIINGNIAHGNKSETIAAGETCVVSTSDNNFHDFNHQDGQNCLLNKIAMSHKCNNLSNKACDESHDHNVSNEASIHGGQTFEELLVASPPTSNATALATKASPGDRKYFHLYAAIMSSRYYKLP